MVTEKPADWTEIEYRNTLKQYAESSSEKENVIEEIYGLLPIQQLMLAQYALSNDTNIYTSQFICKIIGKPDIHICKKAFSLLKKKHDALRTQIVWTHVAIPKCIVLADSTASTKGVTAKNAESSPETVFARERSYGFDIENDNLFRTAIVQESDTVFYLSVTFSNFVLDTWSVNLLIQEFELLYAKIAGGASLIELTEPMEQNRINEKKQRIAAHTFFWSRTLGANNYFAESLAGYQNVTELLCDHRTTEFEHAEQIIAIGKNSLDKKSFDKNSLGGTSFDKPLFEKIKNTARVLNIAPAVIIESIFALTVQKLCNSKDIVYAKSVSTRRTVGRQQEAEAIGAFSNIIPMRISRSADDTFESLFLNVAKISASASRAACANITEVAHNSGNQNGFNYILFSHNTFGEGASYTAARTAKENAYFALSIQKTAQTTHYPLAVFADVFGNTTLLRIEYNACAYDAATIKNFFSAFLLFLETAFVTPQALSEKISGIENIKNISAALALTQTVCEIQEEKEKNYASLFLKQAKIHAEQPALKDATHSVACGETLSFAALERRSGQLAAEIAKTIDMTSDKTIDRAIAGTAGGGAQKIAVMMSRNILFPLAALAIIRSGNACLPIDTTLDENLIRRILHDADVKLILVSGIEQKKFAQKFSQKGTLIAPNIIDVVKFFKMPLQNNCDDFFPDAAPEIETGNEEIGNETPAFVLYTSGAASGSSIGSPIGKNGISGKAAVPTVIEQELSSAVITHGNLLNIYSWWSKEFSVAHNSLFSAPFHFDDVIMQMLIPLACGCEIILTDDFSAASAERAAEDTAEQIAQIIEQENIDFCVLEGALSKKLTENHKTLPLKYLVCSGEKYLQSAADTCYATYNVYTCAQYSGGALLALLDSESVAPHGILGYPVEGTQVLVLDEDDKLLPPGTQGSLCLSGMQLAAWTLKNPYAKDAATAYMVKTGDCVRRRLNGTIEYMGKSDEQFVSNGVRIDIQQLEDAVMAFPKITHCVCIAEKAADAVFVYCFYVAPTTIQSAELSGFLKEILPNSAILPSRFVKIKQAPRTINGKIDKTSLHKIKEIPALTKYRAPKDEIEASIEKIFCQTLLLPKFSRTANFFEEGGTLTSAGYCEQQLAEMYSTESGIISENPVLKDLAEKVKKYAARLSDDDGESRELWSESADLEKKRVSRIEQKYIASILKINHINLRAKNAYSSFLITDATNYLGIYLAQLLTTVYDTIVYAIVPAATNDEAGEIFLSLTEYYFGKRDLNGDKIKPIAGNICEENFDLDSELAGFLHETIDVVINTAEAPEFCADEKLFKTINVDAVRNIVKFCGNADRKKDFVQISDLAISKIPDNSPIFKRFDSILFTEDDLEIAGALPESPYLRSKIEAEKITVAARSNKNENIHTTIFRICALLPAVTAGRTANMPANMMVPKDAEKAPLFRIIESCIQISLLPDEFSQVYFGRVDQCAAAICKMLFCKKLKNMTHHIRDTKVSDIKELLCATLNMPLKDVRPDEYRVFLRKNALRHDIMGAVSYLAQAEKSGTSKKCRVLSDRSMYLLNKLNFAWDKNVSASFLALLKIMLTEKIVFLQTIPSFSSLSENAVFAIACSLTSRSYAKNTFIRHEFKKYQDIIFVRSGSAKILITSDSGWERCVDIETKGAVLGLETVAGQSSAFTVEAVFEELCAYVIDKEHLDALLEKYPEIAKSLIKLLNEKLSEKLRNKALEK
ncbi:MAG: hypothetical protein Ta2A_22370 [Treponemataceae bacterium]|nr:MAG: hypothetical protein Ta2A_22370 [Treponemataceae bacterium]